MSQNIDVKTTKQDIFSLNILFRFVLHICRKYNIDSSHSELHSMQILHFVNENVNSQLKKCPFLQEQLKVIYFAAILHDMCDKKYMNEQDGMAEMYAFLQTEFTRVNDNELENKSYLSEKEITVIQLIISTMSYSTVNRFGYPSSEMLGIYEQAYHIVRESDLLCAYDFDRCVVYGLNKNNEATFYDAYTGALALFENRVFKYKSDGLLSSDYAKNKHDELTIYAEKQIKNWRQIIGNV